MTPHKVQCFDNNGEPYGRYVNPHPEYIGIKPFEYLNGQWEIFEDFTESNTFPFPSGTIGKTYERDEVELGLQVHMKSKDKWEDRDISEIDAYTFKGSEWDTRQIFRLIPQPVEKEPETVEQAIERLTSDGFGLNSENYIVGFMRGFKEGADWQKKQEAYR
jgi:hypothetical protein